MKLGTLVYLIKNDKTLMIHRTKKENDEHSGFWLAPGGKLEKNESPEQCAIREVEEETGLIINSLQFCGHLTFPDYGDSPFGDLWYCWLYKSSDFTGDLITNSPEGRLEWIENSRICELPMWDGDRIFTPYIYGNKIFSGIFTYRKNKFIDYSLEFI